VTDLPHTTRAKQALALAPETAAARGDEFVGTEHLLLGLLAERTGPAAQILEHLGVTHDRDERLLAEARPDG
jgi:ATP-dependent Clp protease ATP-binding subunit ClpC